MAAWVRGAINCTSQAVWGPAWHPLGRISCSWWRYRKTHPRSQPASVGLFVEARPDSHEELVH